MTSHFEEWVQCCRCQKWRFKAPAMKVVPNWHCKLNVFSLTYNTCDAPQEKMPPEHNLVSDKSISEDAEEMVKEIFDGVELCDDAPEFTRSKCACTLCTEINSAVDNWNNSTVHTIPIIQCVLKSLSETSHVAKAIEDDKKFVNQKY